MADGLGLVSRRYLYELALVKIDAEDEHRLCRENRSMSQNCDGIMSLPRILVSSTYHVDGIGPATMLRQNK